MGCLCLLELRSNVDELEAYQQLSVTHRNSFHLFSLRKVTKKTASLGNTLEIWHSEVRGFLARGSLLLTCCFQNLSKPGEAKKPRKCRGQSERVLSQILTLLQH